MKRIILAICLFASVALSAQEREFEFMPSSTLRPSKTVFLYAPDGPKALGEISDPVFSENVETLKLTRDETPGFPEAEKMYAAGGQIRDIGDLARFDLYFPENCCGEMVLVCPGGGYYCLATYGEGLDCAEWLLQRGIAVAVAKTSLPNTHHKVPLADIQIVMRYLRNHQVEWGIKKIGVMGFSAGGHLAASASVLYVDRATRPDFSVLFYPVITMDADVTHIGTRMCLMGRDGKWNERSGRTIDEYFRQRREHDRLIEFYSLERRVTADTPPTYIVLGFDDKAVNPLNSIDYYANLLNCGVQAELHVLSSAPHGFGFDTEIGEARETVSGTLETWLKQMNK